MLRPKGGSKHSPLPPPAALIHLPVAPQLVQYGGLQRGLSTEERSRQPGSIRASKAGGGDQCVDPVCADGADGGGTLGDVRRRDQPESGLKGTQPEVIKAI